MKEVGEKFNYSRGFLRLTMKRDINNLKYNIPFYTFYKLFFGACENLIETCTIDTFRTKEVAVGFPERMEK